MDSFLKVILVYESRYGNTRLVAEKIMEAMGEIGGIETALSELKEVDLNKIIDYDAILMGSPNHFGGPTRGVKKFIDKLGKTDIKGKLVAVFDTYIGSDFEKTVRKMEKRINERVPGLKRLVPGLSIRVRGVKGPISDGELPKCREFGNKLATRLKASSSMPT